MMRIELRSKRRQNIFRSRQSPAMGGSSLSFSISREHSSQVLCERKSESEVAQSYPTLCNPMDCSLRGSSIHGIFQARVLEWVAISFPNERGLTAFEIGQSALSVHREGQQLAQGHIARHL